MKISTATSVFVNYSISDTVNHVADAGYDGVDIWGGRPHVYRRDLSEEELQDLRALLDDRGLSVPSLMPAFFRYPHSLTNPNDVVREDSLDYMRLCADNAVALGAEVLLIVPGRTLAGQSKDDAWARLADSVNSVCEYAKQYDIKLGIEPVNRYVSDLVNTAADAMRLIEQVECDRLGVVLDTGHVHLSDESADEALDRLGDRLYQVHVNDNDGQRQQNLILGEGTFDFAHFVDLLRDRGYEGSLTAELDWHYTLDPTPAVRRVAQIMHSMF